jgi:hypothetical protein
MRRVSSLLGLLAASLNGRCRDDVTPAVGMVVESGNAVGGAPDAPGGNH